MWVAPVIEFGIDWIFVRTCQWTGGCSSGGNIGTWYMEIVVGSNGQNVVYILRDRLETCFILANIAIRRIAGYEDTCQKRSAMM